MWACGALLLGEFTQENQVRLKHEEEKEQTKVDEWKVTSRLLHLFYRGLMELILHSCLVDVVIYWT